MIKILRKRRAVKVSMRLEILLLVEHVGGALIYRYQNDNASNAFLRIHILPSAGTLDVIVLMKSNEKLRILRK